MKSISSLILPLVALLPMSALLSNTKGAPAETFTIGQSDFLHNDKPYVVRCGEMHFSRIPAEYWRDRLKMAKAMGLNTVCAYLFWNVHEPREGEFTLQGRCRRRGVLPVGAAGGIVRDFAAGSVFVCRMGVRRLPAGGCSRTAKMAKVRTPYPALSWTRRPSTSTAVAQGDSRSAAGRQWRSYPHAVQIENEYGSYGTDKQYMGILRDTLQTAGFNVPLFQCDGPSQLPRDHRDDIFAAVNFGGDPQGSFASLRKVQPAGAAHVQRVLSRLVRPVGQFVVTPRAPRDKAMPGQQGRRAPDGAVT